MSIVLSDVTFRYDPQGMPETYALRSVDMTISEGSITAIMGRTGCGKSTLINIAAGLLLPEGGMVEIDGEDINSPHCDRVALRQNIGVVFQYPEKQLFETTIAKDVGFGLKHADMTDEEKEENIRWALDVTGFDYDGVKSKSPLELSGGEKRRLAIAGVLAVKPKYLILDEPFAGLDPKGRISFINRIRTLNEQGTTVVMISHNADAIAMCADEVFILDEGRVACRGTAKEVFPKLRDGENHGVRASTSCRIAAMLADRGMDIKRDIINHDELVTSLARILGAKEGEL